MPRLWPLALLLLAAPARADDQAIARDAAKMFSTLRTETLPNGLRVYLVPVPGATTVTTMVAYKVGAADEQKDQTGLSHYLEHLLFKGTDKYFPGDIDRATQRAGGRNNAYTSEDMTNYHFDFAADLWPVALEIEADRMRNVKIDARHEFEQEKGAVVAELKGGEDRPWDLEYKAILPLLYEKAAPYSHPVIGEESHVRGATAEVIKRHYDAWYHPNNASLIVAGGFDPGAAMVKIKELFGPIPRAELPPRRPEVPSARTKQVRKEFASKFDVPRVMIGFNSVKSGDPDDYALTLIDGILSGGRTSRLYKRLVEGERLASAAGCSNSTGRYAGWVGLNVEMLPGKDRARAEAIVFEELAKLASEPVTEAELARAKRATLAGFLFGRENVHGLADLVAQSVTVNDLDYLKTYLDKLLAVTPADIKRVAAKVFVPTRSVVVTSVPPGDTGAGKPAAPQKPKRQESATAGIDARMAAAKRTVLPNGLTLITLEDHRLPIVTAAATVKGVALREPAEKSGVASLVGDMLEEGAAGRSGDEIALAIETVGGSLSFNRGGASLRVLAPDTELGVRLMLDCLSKPTFPQDALDRVREQQLAAIAEAESQPRSRAARLFMKQVYGDHPNGRSANGTAAIVAKLTAADCKAFHQLAFTPGETILVLVGDFETGQMRALVTKLTADWSAEKRPEPKLAAPPVPTMPVTKIVPDRTAAQTHVFVGHLGVKRSDPDYYTLLVLDNVLGTGPGFTDRLSANLRDRQGLAYTVTAQIAGVGGRPAGRVHRLHRHLPRQVRARPRRLPRGDRPHPRRAGDGARSRGRQEVFARRAAVQGGDFGRRGGATARRGALRAGLRLFERLPGESRGGDAGDGAGGGEEAPAAGQVGGRGGRPDRRGRPAAGGGEEGGAVTPHKSSKKLNRQGIKSAKSERRNWTAEAQGTQSKQKQIS